MSMWSNWRNAFFLYRHIHTCTISFSSSSCFQHFSYFVYCLFAAFFIIVSVFIRNFFIWTFAVAAPAVTAAATTTITITTATVVAAAAAVLYVFFFFSLLICFVFFIAMTRTIAVLHSHTHILYYVRSVISYWLVLLGLRSIRSYVCACMCVRVCVRVSKC